MDIGIGLPNPVPGTDGGTLVGWARRAEEAGFSTLATIDRIVYPSYDSFIALAAAAAATEHVGLFSNIVIAPLRDGVLLAKEAASVDRLSNGRLTLGLAVGARVDDYEVVEKDFGSRGRRFEEQLELMPRVWRGEHLTESGRASVPLPGREIPILVGGATDRSVERAVKWGAGYTAGGIPPDAMASIAEKVRRAWAEAGREGEPRLAVLSYFALGPKADEGARSYLTDYYARLGPMADAIAERAPKTPEVIKETVSAFADIGLHELVFDPTIAELDQVDRLADVVL